MNSRQPLRSNFAHLQSHDERLVRLGVLAERYFAEDPNTCLLKLRQLAEGLARLAASNTGLLGDSDERQYDLLGRLRDRGILPPEVFPLFAEIRRTGNAANHAFAGDHRAALASMKIAWQLAVWFHRAFGDPKFKSGPFIPPAPPPDESTGLRAELDALNRELAGRQSEQAEQTLQLARIEEQLRAAKDERSFWENMAAEVERDKADLLARFAEIQAAAAALPASSMAARAKASAAAAKHIRLDEAETRLLIDEQLRQAGWEADSARLRHGLGTCPEKGRNIAIAEWPTANGPADYMLFAGLTPLAPIEAKRKHVDISGTLHQAKRYSRGFTPADGIADHGRTWGANGEFHLPFVYATNGRPYLRQLETKSGIWFCDLRRPDNHGHALQGWHSPEGLMALLRRDEAAAHDQLASETFDYGFVLRNYQRNAILKTEDGVASGLRELLLAMATGTGKTKTCIALVYRFLKTKRFRRILYLVDRSALGEQAANAFKDTRMESLQTFANVFGIKELDEQSPDTDTAVHLATIQGMVQRVLYPSEDCPPPPVDQYDCIVVDECHRGYLLDRELSDTELTFRSFEDYISKYRRVLDYFDAVKIGLTATPALHTSRIFGSPIFTYSYREAVIDGFLIDHDPPFKIETELSKKGIIWKKGETVQAYLPDKSQIDLFKAPDEIKIEIEQFNKKVITRSFNEVVCQYLARELDPESRQKTLIFCATDAHADLVVALLKDAFKDVYGAVDDDAVIKITGAADKPLHLIRRFKNERMPNVAVTVDLLTTGVDVPEICNLVFLRRVNSRILFDQMLGRATRLCEEIEKETFRVFDAVGLYDALKGMTAMRPVVVDPNIPFERLIDEIRHAPTDEARELVRDQIAAKLQRRKRHLSETALRDFETRAGMAPDEFIARLRELSPEKVAEWFTAHPGLGEILDRKSDRPADPILISGHEDKLREVKQGFGPTDKPEDYIEAFKTFINSKGNDIPAIVTVVTRPQSLTRRHLRELQLELDRAGFSVANLKEAWRRATNREIAANIIGYIRQAALGDPLVPFAERVDHALQAMLASRNWTRPQREWLKKLAAQTKANNLVDRAAFDEEHLIFKREGGGFNRLNKLFDGNLEQVLNRFNDTLWTDTA